MAGMTNTHANTLLNFEFGSDVSYSKPATWHVVLFTSSSGLEAGTTSGECSGGAYVRKAITNNSTNFPTSTAQEKNLDVSVSFVEATTNWGTIEAVGLSNSATRLDPIQYFATLDTAQTINSGDIFRIARGPSGLRITLD